MPPTASRPAMEDINNKIKNLGQQGYGYPDDDYFFLKMFDVSRRKPGQNPMLGNICN